jgi:hypothetical protein
MRIFLLLAVGIAGCAGTPPTAPLDNSEEHATLTLVSNDPYTDLPGFFASLDGHDLKDIPRTILVKPGKRTVGYVCHVVLDQRPPTVTAYFEPHKTYVFRCAGEHATVEHQ